MKVRELVQDLLLVDQDLDVYLGGENTKDGTYALPMDGNGYGWSVAIVDEDGEEVDAFYDDEPNAIIFWPVD